MKILTSLLVALTFGFVGLTMTGCDSDENTVVESDGPDTETGDSVLATEEDMQSYEEEMAKQYGGN